VKPRKKDINGRRTPRKEEKRKTEIKNKGKEEVKTIEERM
jgi:hypothetical protein